MEKIFGIDLGTTNSSIAYINEDHLPQPMALPGENPIVPSVVAFHQEQQSIIVGEQAKNYLNFDPQNAVRSVKRLMGTNQIIKLGNNTFSPEEISSFILRHLASIANKALSVKVNKVVITVPAYFNDAQRRATIKAGELAELDVVRIINEPTAASLVYDFASTKETTSSNTRHVLVYDLGGGTFDVSVLNIRGEIREVLASTGNTSLGGDDFDDKLVHFFLNHLCEKAGNELRSDFILKLRLKAIAEKTKIALSEKTYVRVKEPGLTAFNEKVVNLDIEISRHEFEDMTQPLLQQTKDKTMDALAESGLALQDIHKVILVGGATRMPMVQEMLMEIFGRGIGHSIDPDLCVSMGAAIQGGLIAGEPLGRILLDVTAHSLGIKTLDNYAFFPVEADYFSVIIPRNSRIPIKRTNMYYTVTDNQPNAIIEVYQGESPKCSENTPVGEFPFELCPAPEGCPLVVEFSYDLEGLVHVTVEQKGYDNKKEVTLNIRERTVLDRDNENESVLKDGPVNYIAQKARSILKSPLLDSNEHKAMNDILHKYEKAIRKEDDEEVIDELEEKLLDYIALVEEREEDG